MSALAMHQLSSTLKAVEIKSADVFATVNRQLILKEKMLVTVISCYCLFYSHKTKMKHHSRKIMLHFIHYWHTEKLIIPILRCHDVDFNENAKKVIGLIFRVHFFAVTARLRCGVDSELPHKRFAWWRHGLFTTKIIIHFVFSFIYKCDNPNEV